MVILSQKGGKATITHERVDDAPHPNSLAGQFNASGAYDVMLFFYPYGYLY
jgi:hypothetical protein